MTKIYFLGGENVSKRDAKEINASAFEAAGGSPSVLVIPWARPSFDAKFRRRRMLVNYFRNLGAIRVEFAEFSDSLDSIRSQMAQSNLVYLTGGQVGALLSRLRTSGIDALLCSYQGVIVGRSAGAMVLGEKCLVTNRYSGSRKIARGLGLVDFSVKAHYCSVGDDLLRKASVKGKIFAVPKCSAVIWDNGALSFLGKVFLFKGGEKSVANPRES